MAENSKISLATHTWTPWMLPQGRRADDRYWSLPGKWQRAALKSKERDRICLAPDPFEEFSGPIVDDLRRDMFDVIDQTPNLDYLLLTKRPENIKRHWTPPHDGCIQCLVCQQVWGNDAVYKCPDCGNDDSREMTHCISERRDNVHLLYSASDQETLDAGIGHLLECRDLSPVLGLSLEPLIGPVDLTKCLTDEPGFAMDLLSRAYRTPAGKPRNDCDPELKGKPYDRVVKNPQPIDWVIVGGESGPNARPCQIEWIMDIIQQCKAAGVACFVKQLGAKPYGKSPGGKYDSSVGFLKLDDPKGADPSEWPEEMRVQQHPEENQNGE